MVHQYKNNGFNIVLDVCSGSVHVVDELVYDIIELYEDKPYETIEAMLLLRQEEMPGKYGEEVGASDIKEAYDAITALKDDGKLFTEDSYKDLVIDFKKRKTVVKALCLNVSHDCNLACKYCFAGQVSIMATELL